MAVATESNPDLQSFLESSSASRNLATISSVVCGVCLVLLLPLIYLFVDLMVWKGRVPGYSQLPPGRQSEFRDYWNLDPNSVDRVKNAWSRIGSVNLVNNENAEWETRWKSATLESFGKISPAAADEYIQISATENRGLPQYKHGNSETRLGILPTIARENGHWTRPILGNVASAMPWTWKPGASGTANANYLLTLFAAAFALTCAAGFLAHAARHFASLAAVDGATKLRRAIYLQAFRLGSVAVSPEARAEAANILTERVDVVREEIESSSRTRIRNGIIVVGAMLVLVLVNPLVALVVLCSTAALWLVVGQIAAWFRRDARHAARAAEATRVRLTESVERMGLTKAYLMDRFAQNRVERQLDDAATADRRRRRGMAFSRPLLVSLGGIASVVLMLILGGVVLGGGLSMAGMAEMLAGAGMLAWAVRSGMHGRVAARSARAATSDIAEFLGRRGEQGQPIDAEFLQPIAKRIELLGLGFRESGTGTMLLEDVTATIHAGTRVAIVADNRDSLHTLAHALTRFLEPTAGEIKADGKNLRWVTTDSLRTQIAIVSEGAMTFMDTVSNNIGCGDPGFGLPQIMEAAKVAHAHQFIQKLPYGYETSIGGSGVVLTPGQQYRIALARAILRDPSVVIVEEPTAALDPDTLALVDDTLARIQAGRTIVVLAHREATMRAADQILVLEKGRLVASGTHEILVQSSELYRRLGYRDSVGRSRLTERE